MNAPANIDTTLKLPVNRTCYYGGAWHAPKSGREADTINPGTGESLGKVADAGAADVDAAVAAAKTAFKEWRNVLPLERAKMLRRIAEVLRKHARRAGDDRCRRLRQSGSRDGERRDDRRRADRVLRRARHRDEGQLDPDGPERGQFLGARAARRHRAHHSVQPPVHVLRRQSPPRRSRRETPSW